MNSYIVFIIILIYLVDEFVLEVLQYLLQKSVQHFAIPKMIRYRGFWCQCSKVKLVLLKKWFAVGILNNNLYEVNIYLIFLFKFVKHLIS